VGKATVGGELLHARVLDYMTRMVLQKHAVTFVCLPTGRHAYVNVGYAGFIGSVTGMNEKKVAFGEMGGRGDGLWDGMPMAFLIRKGLEEADSLEHAIRIFRETPRTCEYYYVLSDPSKAMAGVHCTSTEFLVLEPGEQNERLPLVPKDTVLMSAGERAQVLSARLQEAHGAIDVARLIEIIKRPVAMSSNLHNAIFAPAALDMWVADAGRDTPACDEPYVRCNLTELVAFYETQNVPVAEASTPGAP